MEENITDRDREIVANSVKRIAKALNFIEATTEELEYMFERHGEWNSEIKYQIEAAASKLGFSLATLNRWFDDDFDSEDRS